MFYAIRDTSTTTYDGTKLNTEWIDANKTTDAVTSNNYYDTTDRGGLTSVSSPTNGNSSNSATIKVFIPTNKSSSSTYLYFRIGVPMNEKLSIQSVNAQLSFE